MLGDEIVGPLHRRPNGKRSNCNVVEASHNYPILSGAFRFARPG
jgi:hypothetical protein